ncbi:MAG TPA: dihydrofolate reductase family protein, partial [Candidatus Nitrosopolaris sp.]|nr:dihydrofolate reductase family protein [Candidatus Nitrosopolaris sp.]
ASAGVPRFAAPRPTKRTCEDTPFVQVLPGSRSPCVKVRARYDFAVTLNITLARTLLRAGLVDELNLLIHPIVVGTGQRLFEADGVQLPLKTVSADTFGTGVVHLVCHPA